jgi:hypothetical protein
MAARRAPSRWVSLPAAATRSNFPVLTPSQTCLRQHSSQVTEELEDLLLAVGQIHSLDDRSVVEGWDSLLNPFFSIRFSPPQNVYADMVRQIVERSIPRQLNKILH